MKRYGWRVGGLLLLGCLAAGCRGGSGGSGTFPELSPPASSKPDENGLVTQIRPQVARISDSDPLQVVLHWATTEGPVTRKNAIPVDWFDTCNNLTVHVTTPDGKQHDLKPQRQKHPGHSSGEFYSSPTLFIKLTRKGMEIGPRYAYTADWRGGPVPALEESGTYKVSVSGALQPGETRKGNPVPFASPVVEIERGVAGYLALDGISTLAFNHIKRKLKSGHETGGQVYDDADGNRLVHLTGPSSELWHFTIYTVQVSPTGKVLNVFSREVSNCLAEGTKLDGEAGLVAIEEVRAGDRLWGYDLQRRERVLTTVRFVRRGEAGETLRLECGLRVTGGHPVYAGGRWMAARDLCESDDLLRADGKTVRAGKIERVSGRAAVYDVTVDEPHNFFAAGVLVHNKSRGHWPHLDDLWYRLWSPQKTYHD